MLQHMQRNARFMRYGLKLLRGFGIKPFLIVFLREQDGADVVVTRPQYGQSVIRISYAFTWPVTWCHLIHLPDWMIHWLKDIWGRLALSTPKTDYPKTFLAGCHLTASESVIEFCKKYWYRHNRYNKYHDTLQQAAYYTILGAHVTAWHLLYKMKWK